MNSKRINLQIVIQYDKNSKMGRIRKRKTKEMVHFKRIILVHLGLAHKIDYERNLQ